MPHDPTPAADGQRLRLAIGRVARRMRRMYAVRDGATPTFIELAVLVHLAREGPSTPGALADRERVTSAAIAPVLRELVTRGLVTRRRNPGDGRSTIVAIEDAGRAVLDDRELAVVTGLLRALDEEFTAEERAALLAVIPLLDRLADTL